MMKYLKNVNKDFQNDQNNKHFSESNVVFESESRQVTVDQPEFAIVDGITDNEMELLKKKLKMKQDRPLLTWNSPKGGVDVMITQGGKIRLIFTGQDSSEAKQAAKLLGIKGLKILKQ